MSPLRNLLIIFDFDFFQFRIRSFDNLEYVVSYHNFFTNFGNTFVIMNDISC